jgi:hypothetical protein
MTRRWIRSIWMERRRSTRWKWDRDPDGLIAIDKLFSYLGKWVDSVGHAVLPRHDGVRNVFHSCFIVDTLTIILTRHTEPAVHRNSLLYMSASILYVGSSQPIYDSRCQPACLYMPEILSYGVSDLTARRSCPICARVETCPSDSLKYIHSQSSICIAQVQPLDLMRIKSIHPRLRRSPRTAALSALSICWPTRPVNVLTAKCSAPS